MDSSSGKTVCFGPFTLQPAARLIDKAGVRLALGSRALDILIVLAERAGEVVSHRELTQRVWRGLVVSPNSLRVHVSGLRKALGDGEQGLRYIANVPGQGYCFVAPVRHLGATRSGVSGPASTIPAVRVDAMPAAAAVAAIQTASTAQSGQPQPNPAPVRRKDNLPHALTTFIGREREIAEVRRLLSATRLLTLTGSGGCGKTRLALQLGAQVVDAYSDGVWLTELATSTDPAQVPKAIAEAVMLKEQPGKTSTEVLCDHLASHHALLVLDNAEHLLDACARIVETLLQRCERLAIVCTSRQPLGLTGELTYRVPSLAVPDARRDTDPEQIAQCESVRLFVDRARLQRQDFVVTAANASALASICSRLDGIALAIELAAPRVRSMTLQELCGRLDERFSVLTEGSRTALPRHRTLRSLIDWSYELLSEAEKRLLQRVAIFSGGWTLAAAERVCASDDLAGGQIVEVLTALIDKNLVIADMRASAVRFGMLETVRDYASTRLREGADEVRTRRQHFEHFVALAENAYRHELAADAPEWAALLDQDHDNLRAALRNSCLHREDSGDDALRLAGFMQWYWSARGRLGEARELISMALASATHAHDKAARARVLRGLGGICYFQSDIAAARRLYEQALALELSLGDRRSIAVTQGALARAKMADGDTGGGIELLMVAVAIARELDDTSLLAVFLHLLGASLYRGGDYEAAREPLAQSLVLWRAEGNYRAAHALLGLSQVALAEGDIESAYAFAEQSFTEHSAPDDTAKPLKLAAFAKAAIAIGSLERAVEAIEEAIAFCRERDIPAYLDEVLLACGAVALLRGGAIPAARIWGHADEQITRHGRAVLMNAPGQAWLDTHVRAARAALGDDAAFDQAWEAGRAMDFDQAVRHALAAIAASPVGLPPVHRKR